MGTMPTFQVDGPVRPESRMIGRAQTLVDLYDRLARSGQNTLLLSPRRTGKTSVALACLDRIRNNGGLAADLDLSSSAVSSGASLADEMARQARAIGLSSVGPNAVRRWASKVRSQAKSTREAMNLMGLRNYSELPEAISQALAPVDGATKLSEVLRATNAALVLADQNLVVLLDEIQEVSKWEDSTSVQSQIAETMRLPESRINFLFAGSEESSVATLFVEGSPLYYAGVSFSLPQISHDDWSVGIQRRFDELGTPIAPALVADVLRSSGGHPQRTMRVCFHIEEWCKRTSTAEVDDTTVRRAITDARGHPSWR